MKLIMTKGLPASGKSTWAKSMGGYKRINKDDLRAMLDNGKWSGANEKFVLEIRDFLVQHALINGFNVIVDDTNLHPKHEERLKQIVKDYNQQILMPGKKPLWEFEIKDFTDVPIEVCIERDLKRPNSVGEKVIRNMYKQFLAPKPEPIVSDPKLPLCIICDIDGTLAKMGDRSPYDWSKVGLDTLNFSVANVLNTYKALDAQNPLWEETRIIIVSGRDSICRTETKRWLEENCIEYHHLFMRKKGDNRDDRIVKKEIYETKIKGKANVLFVLDDRNKVVEMWRSLGLTCLQVAEGDF